MKAILKRDWLDELGHIDAEFPVRSLPKSPVKNIGLFPTSKASVSQQYESLLERDFMTLQEFDRRVSRFTSHSIMLRWKHGDHRVRKYTPDLIVRYNPFVIDGRLVTSPLTVFEVKTRQGLKKNWRDLKPRFRAAIAWTRARNHAFRIVTEKEIQTPYLLNARFLLRYRTEMPNAGTTLEQLERLETGLRRLGESTPRALLASLASDIDEQAALIPWLWFLVDQGQIMANLSQLLTMSSPICLHQERFR